MSYLGSVASNVGCALAGFNPNGKGYYLPRACLDPPAELMQQIFPGLEQVEESVSKVQWCYYMFDVMGFQSFADVLVSLDGAGFKHSIACVQHNQECGQNDKLTAAASYCKVLRYLRKVLLQDAAFLTHIEIFDQRKGVAPFNT